MPINVIKTKLNNKILYIWAFRLKFIERTINNFYRVDKKYIEVVIHKFIKHYLNAKNMILIYKISKESLKTLLFKYWYFAYKDFLIHYLIFSIW